MDEIHITSENGWANADLRDKAALIHHLITTKNMRYIQYDDMVENNKEYWNKLMPEARLYQNSILFAQFHRFIYSHREVIEDLKQLAEFIIQYSKCNLALNEAISSLKSNSINSIYTSDSKKLINSYVLSLIPKATIQSHLEKVLDQRMYLFEVIVANYPIIKEHDYLKINSMKDLILTYKGYLTLELKSKFSDFMHSIKNDRPRQRFIAFCFILVGLNSFSDFETHLTSTEVNQRLRDWAKAFDKR